jgi:hypothetical protein
MNPNLDISDAFTLEDIRKIRDDIDRRFMDENGKVDWKGLCAEQEKGAAITRAEIARIRAERGISFK